MDDETNNIDYSDVENGMMDEQGDLADYQNDFNEDQQFGGPMAQRPTRNMFTFFESARATKDSTKVSNLDKFELGKMPLNVRNSKHIALLAGVLHNKAVSDYYNGQAEITNATAMSKRGWFLELAVSQKRTTERRLNPVGNTNAAAPAKKGFLNWGKGNTNPSPQQ